MQTQSKISSFGLLNQVKYWFRLNDKFNGCKVNRIDTVGHPSDWVCKICKAKTKSLWINSDVCSHVLYKFPILRCLHSMHERCEIPCLQGLSTDGNTFTWFTYEKKLADSISIANYLIPIVRFLEGMIWFTTIWHFLLCTQQLVSHIVRFSGTANKSFIVN